MSLLASISQGTLIALGVGIAVAYVALLAIAVAFNVVRDARRRSHSWAFAIFAFLLAFLPPFLGAIIYVVIRPPRPLDEERALAAEAQILAEPVVVDRPTRPCPTCGRDLEEDFVMCPYCRTQFARRCAACEHTLRLGWPVCPFCGAEVGGRSLPQPAPRAVSPPPIR
ncbi:MAG: zinc ribbon domain-containing protein [Candidatus Dormibacteria bacterium]|jgi:RNA polymerase subunit RPABC4/transcription elongation factor Spt4